MVTQFFRKTTDFIHAGTKGVYCRLTCIGVMAKPKDAPPETLFEGHFGTFLMICFDKEVYKTDSEAQTVLGSSEWFGTHGSFVGWLRVHDEGYNYWIWARPV